MGRDYGIIEEPYWEPSKLVGTRVRIDSQNMSVKKKSTSTLRTLLHAIPLLVNTCYAAYGWFLYTVANLGMRPKETTLFWAKYLLPELTLALDWSKGTPHI